VIDFPDYSTEELTSIFDLYLDEKQLTLTPEAREKLTSYVESLPRRRGFGNGREMRNLFNEVVRRQAVWAGRNGQFDPIDLTQIGGLDAGLGRDLCGLVALQALVPVSAAV